MVRLLGALLLSLATSSSTSAQSSASSASSASSSTAAGSSAGAGVDVQAATAGTMIRSTEAACVNLGRAELGAGLVALVSRVCPGVNGVGIVEERWIERKKVREDLSWRRRRVALPLVLAPPPTIGED